MIELATPEALSAIVSLAVVSTHAIAHMAAGEEWAFEDAGVNAAGISVALAAGIATYAILTRSGVTIT